VTTKLASDRLHESLQHLVELHPKSWPDAGGNTRSGYRTSGSSMPVWVKPGIITGPLFRTSARLFLPGPVAHRDDSDASCAR